MLAGDSPSHKSQMSSVFARDLAAAHTIMTVSVKARGFYLSQSQSPFSP